MFCLRYCSIYIFSNIYTMNVSDFIVTAFNKLPLNILELRKIKTETYIVPIKEELSHNVPHIHFNSTFAGFPSGSSNKINDKLNESGVLEKLNEWKKRVELHTLTTKVRSEWILLINELIKNVKGSFTVLEKTILGKKYNSDIPNGIQTGQEFYNASLEEKENILQQLFQDMFQSASKKKLSLKKNTTRKKNIKLSYNKTNCKSLIDSLFSLRTAPLNSEQDLTLLNHKMIRIYIQMIHILRTKKPKERKYEFNRLCNTLISEPLVRERKSLSFTEEKKVHNKTQKKRVII